MVIFFGGFLSVGWFGRSFVSCLLDFINLTTDTSLIDFELINIFLKHINATHEAAGKLGNFYILCNSFIFVWVAMEIYTDIGLHSLPAAFMRTTIFYFMFYLNFFLFLAESLFTNCFYFSFLFTESKGIFSL